MSKPIALSVSCHAFNKAGDMVALSPNTNEIIIYATTGAEDVEKWVPKYVLSEHGGLVSGIDWAPESNLIVSSGHDRNAYVWRYDAESDAWKPTLVVLRINRAATSVKWSPLGNKFAVTSGAKCVPICHYMKANDWWISKMIKKHKSTVLSTAWCPNNKLIITGSSDNKCRIFSAYIKKVDSSEDDGFGAVWPDQHKFGELLAEFDHSKAWVHSVAWSPTGFRLAWAGHGSTVHFAQIVVGAPIAVQQCESPDLPFLDIKFLSDDALLAAGFSCNPTLYTASGDAADPKWSLSTQLDKAEKDAQAGPKDKSAFAGARAMFAASADKGYKAGADQTVKETVLPTRHQNTIVCLWQNRPGLVTSSGVDGRVVFWELSKFGVDTAALKIQ